MTKPRFDEGTIISVGKTTLANARSEVGALSVFGVTEPKLAQLETDIITGEAMPGESLNRIQLRDFTKTKNDALDECKEWGAHLRMRLEFAFGVNSHERKSFPSKQFHEAKDSETDMMPVMEILISLAEKYNAELAEHGQTEEVLAHGQECLENLRLSDAEQELEKDLKKSATQERYQLFQNIYKQTNNINRVGRTVFKNDPVKRALFASKWPAKRSLKNEDIDEASPDIDE